MQSVIRPLMPENVDPDDWFCQLVGEDAWCWDHKSGFRMISALSAVREPKHPEQNGPHYHVSMSWFRWDGGFPSGPHRVDSQTAADRLRLHFPDYSGWEEDNHVPGGRVRNFWLPVAENRRGVQCFCKAHEPAIREDNGDFVWRPVSD